GVAWCGGVSWSPSHRIQLVWKLTRERGHWRGGGGLGAGPTVLVNRPPRAVPRQRPPRLGTGHDINLGLREAVAAEERRVVQQHGGPVEVEEEPRPVQRAGVVDHDDGPVRRPALADTGDERAVVEVTGVVVGVV